MDTRELIILAGLMFAACGHLVTHGLLGARTAWVRLESCFPPAWRSEPSLAGPSLLVIGALFVLVPVLG